ncbi:MAG: methyltransferase domain-containing protein [Candidatus Saganbacteria bacterium]|nr:methyltransferase domain-containing protein [Candidatus Saganbacteria bacterium]
MHPEVYQEFGRICSRRNVHGAILEVGATPDNSTLLTLNALKGATEKIGINLDGPYSYKDFSIIKGDANSMTCFEEERFDTVLCNSVLEHDKYFWKTIAEIKRVTKSGGLIVIGAPGYVSAPLERYVRKMLKNIALLHPLTHEISKGATLTMNVHNFPGDHYRFSAQAFEEVIFEGMREVEIQSLLLPPRIIGSGIKP